MLDEMDPNDIKYLTDPEEYFSDQQPPSEIESDKDLVGDLFPDEGDQNQEF